MILALSVRSGVASSLRGSLGIHDPSTIVKCKDRYYVFGTGRGIVSKSSADKVFWESGQRVFSTAPAWTTNAVPAFDGTFWAPDVIYRNGLYYLYYSVSSWGRQVSAIGLATNPTLDPADPAYRWTDKGAVIQSANGSAYNTIDPGVSLDAAGNPWLVFGSYWNGIYLVQLDPLTGLRSSPGSPLHRLAYNSSIEAACIYRRGGYYYLFVNWGSCCSGVNSTYNIRVGRSTSITGPYLDRNGVDMANNGGTIFLQSNGKFAGPGHAGVLSEQGKQWFSYHYYDAGAWAPWYSAYGPAALDVSPLTWTDDNWPVVTNDWSAVYKFDADARDENQQYYGRLLNGASIQSDPSHGHVLDLNGTNQYVRLPAGLANARTFTAVVKWNGGAPWQRIFDFGVDTGRYLMLTPSSDTGKIRCDIKAGGGVQSLVGTTSLPVGTWTHVAVTLDGTRGVLYVNGAPVATRGNMTIAPLDVLAQTNHLGHSKFSADPDFNGQIADFRVYGRYLSAAEITSPLLEIKEPVGGAVYWPGMRVKFRGSATDFMGNPLGPSNLTWRIEYCIDGRNYLAFGPGSGISDGYFNIATNAADSGVYRISLTAKDLSGRETTVVSSLVPAHPPEEWVSYYPFRDSAQDVNGHYDAGFQGGASLQADPTRGKVVNLSGSGQYVSLPAGASRFKTFMAWVKWNGGAPWQRIFDFGNDTNRYTVLTPSAANGKLRFNISVNSIPGEQLLEGPGPLPVGTWTHVAVVLDGKSGTLFTNGVPVATNSAMDLIPETLNTTNNFLGKSQWPDPYFQGQISSVRVFSRALTPAEITAPQCSIQSPACGTLYRPGQTIFYSGGAADFFDASIQATGLVWTVQYISSGLTNTVAGPISGVTNGSFTIPADGGASTNGYYRVILNAADALKRTSSAAANIYPAAAMTSAFPWTSFYPFSNGALDASNRYNGTLNGGASIIADAERGSVLNLNGSGQYANLPSAAGNCQTLCTWVRWNGGGAWQRIFDFGQNNEKWWMLTPLDSDGRMQCAITTARSDYVQVIQADGPLPSDVWNRVAVTLDGHQGILYVNGEAIAVNNSVNLLPSDVMPWTCYLGRSHYAADPYFSGRLDSLRLDSQTLSFAELLSPRIRLLEPSPGWLYSGGSSLAFSAAATDSADLPLPASAFKWSAKFHHDAESEPAFGPVFGVTNGSFALSSSGPLTTNCYYSLDVSATDAAGRTASASADIFPQLSRIALASVPSGLGIGVDGVMLTTPAAVPLVAGLRRTLSAPNSQAFNGSNLDFILWSDGGTAIHEFTVPLSDWRAVASYVVPQLSLGIDSTAVHLVWPDWAASLNLVQATNLTPPATWTLLTNAPQLLGGQLMVSLPLTSTQAFFRLEPR